MPMHTDKQLEQTIDLARNNNETELKNAVQALLRELKESNYDIQSSTQFIHKLSLIDKSGTKNEANITIDLSLFKDSNSFQYCDVKMIIKDHGNNEIAFGHFTFKPNNNDLIATSSNLAVTQERFKGTHIGSAIVFNGELVKLSYAKILHNTYGFGRLISYIYDLSIPPAWTTQSALALGYKRVKGKKDIYIRIDDLSRDLDVSKSRSLTETWKSQKRNPIAMIMRAYRAWRMSE